MYDVNFSKFYSIIVAPSLLVDHFITPTIPVTAPDYQQLQLTLAATITRTCWVSQLVNDCYRVNTS